MSSSNRTYAPHELPNLCKLSYVIFYALLKKGINFGINNKNIDDIISFQLPISFEDTISISNLESYKLCEFFYQENTNNTKDYWLSKWSFRCSPFHQAQKILSRFGIYLSNDSNDSNKPIFSLSRSKSKISKNDVGNLSSDSIVDADDIEKENDLSLWRFVLSEIFPKSSIYEDIYCNYFQK